MLKYKVILIRVLILVSLTFIGLGIIYRGPFKDVLNINTEYQENQVDINGK